MLEEKSIGQIIPYFMNDVSVDFTGDSSHITELQQRFHELKNNPDQLKDIFNSIPKHTCLSQHPFLKNNHDFFLAFSLLSEHQEIDVHNAGDFIEHLNNCYWCFSLYNQFIKDVYFESKEIENQKRGPNNAKNI